MVKLWSVVLIIFGILIIQPGTALVAPASVDGSVIEMVRTGRIDALDLKIGDSLETAFLKYGRPERKSDQDYFLGSPYYNYGSYYVIYHHENRAEEERPITGFIFLSPSKIFGLEVGRSTLEDVRALLGVSDWEIMSGLEMSDEERPFDPATDMGKIRATYIIGEYTLDVYFEDDFLRYVVFCRQRTEAQFASAVDVFFDFRNMTQTYGTKFQPLIVQGRYWMPLRSIATTFGFSVRWEASDSSVHLQRQEEVLTLWLDRVEILRGNEKMTLATASQIIQGTTYIPVESMAVLFDEVVTQDVFQGKESIWVTYFDLVRTLEDLTHYMVLEHPQLQVYRLKAGQETATGVRLGDSVAKVRARYGIPFKEQEIGDRLILIYIGKYDTESHPGFALYFFIEQDAVDDVRLYTHD